MWPVPRRRKGATNSGAELAHAAFAQAATVACRLRAAAVIGYREKTATAAFFSSLKSLECISAWLQKKTATACDGWSSVTAAPKDTREACHVACRLALAPSRSASPVPVPSDL